MPSPDTFNLKGSELLWIRDNTGGIYDLIKKRSLLGGGVFVFSTLAHTPNQPQVVPLCFFPLLSRPISIPSGPKSLVWLKVA